MPVTTASRSALALRTAELTPAVLTGAVLTGAALTGAVLTGARLAPRISYSAPLRSLLGGRASPVPGGSGRPASVGAAAGVGHLEAGRPRIGAR